MHLPLSIRVLLHFAQVKHDGNARKVAAPLVHLGRTVTVRGKAWQRLDVAGPSIHFILISHTVTLYCHAIPQNTWVLVL